MKKAGLKKNLIFTISLGLVGIIVLLNIRISMRFTDFSHYLITEKLTANVNSLNLRLDESERNSRAAAVSMARYPDAIKAIREQDKEEIIRLFTDAYDLYNVNFFTVTDPEGVVLVRTHEPENFGDSIANQRNIRGALEGKVSSCYEAGTVVKVSVRTGAPVYDTDGTLLGVISAGIRFDTEETVDALKDLLGAEVSVFFGDTRITTTFMNGGERVTGTLLEPDIAETVLQNKQEYIGEVALFGKILETYYKPLLNAEGEAFAILVLGIPIDDLKTESNMLLIEAVLIGVIGVVISVILLNALRNIMAADKAKSAFLSAMSHEIRTPMNAILGIAEIQLHRETLEPETRESLEKIYSSGDMLLGIINDILDFSKIEAGKLELLPDKYETASLISDTVQLNLMRIGSKPIEFELYVDETLPSVVTGDELRVKQILNNLLSNAFKYTHSGKVTLSAKTEESAGEDDKVMLVFCVTDTGQGMTNEQVGKLFDEYSRFNMEANRSTEGTGLGMSITRNLIRLMDGEISVESEPGKGSAFTVRLPQSKSGSDVLGKELAENLRLFRTDSRARMKRAQISREPMPYGSVMVVDDVETNIYVAKGLLAPYELKIDSAESGFEAIEKIKNGNIYDIVFMDHMMPKMDGMEAAKIIRGMGYEHPIVALTANAVAGQADVFLSNGFDDFISKPIDIRQLNAVLNKLVRDRHLPEVVEAARQKKPEDAGKEPEQGSADSKIAEIFVRDALKAIPSIEDIIAKFKEQNQGSYTKEDIRSYVIQTHGLKSALANVGKLELSVLAGKLEELGRAENIEMICSETTPFLNSMRTLIEELTPESDSESGGAIDDMTDEDRAYLCEKLLVIKSACEDFDERTANDMLKELGFKKWPRAVKELLNLIEEHLLHSDFDEAAERIALFLESEQG